MASTPKLTIDDLTEGEMAEMLERIHEILYPNTNMIGKPGPWTPEQKIEAIYSLFESYNLEP